MERTRGHKFHLSKLARDPGSDRRGHALWALPEAAAMLVVARRAAGGELDRSDALFLADRGAAGMVVVAGGHGVVVGGHVLRHFTRGMNGAAMHEQHRRQSQFSPCHHHQKQGRRNGFLQHQDVKDDS